MALPPSMAELAHASLVMSLGYLALERFRYRGGIESLRQDTMASVERLFSTGSDFRQDKAWTDIQDFRPKGILTLVLGQPLDTFLTFLGSIYCFGLLAFGAIADEAGWHLDWGSGVDWLIIALLVISGIQPVAFVFLGRRAVTRATRSFESNLKHFETRSDRARPHEK